MSASAPTEGTGALGGAPALLAWTKTEREDGVVSTTQPTESAATGLGPGSRSVSALAEASRIMREALKDRAYRATPLGLEVARYYRWKRNEWGATESTLRDYEAILARLCLDHADLELLDFEPPVGTERLREFWDRHWSDRSPRTRAKVLSVLRDFFAWGVRERNLHGDPTTPIRAPKKRGVERQTVGAATVLRLIAAQTRMRDRIALLLLFRLGLRKSELAHVQFKDFSYAGRRLRIYGKGGTNILVPVPDEIRLALSTYTTVERCKPGEYLLYPEKIGRTGAVGMGVIWEDRMAPMTSSTLHRWWHRRLQDAGLPPRPMHEARHTAITEFLRKTGNLKLAQQLARHASIQTTADIYAHLDDADLERALGTLPSLLSED